MTQYLFVGIDHFPRFVVLAPLKNKTATAVGHTLVTQLFVHTRHLVCCYAIMEQNFVTYCLRRFVHYTILSRLSQWPINRAQMDWLKEQTGKFLKLSDLSYKVCMTIGKIGYHMWGGV